MKDSDVQRLQKYLTTHRKETAIAGGFAALVGLTVIAIVRIRHVRGQKAKDLLQTAKNLRDEKNITTPQVVLTAEELGQNAGTEIVRDFTDVLASEFPDSPAGDSLQALGALSKIKR